MGFDASNAGIPPLDYDFGPFVKGCRGRTPEPTEDQVYDFQFAVKDAATILGRESFDPNDQAEVMKFMNSLTRDDMKKINDTIFEAMGKLTSGKPSKEQMQELSKQSYRHGQAYMGSLMGDIMDPKASNSVMNQ